MILGVVKLSLEQAVIHKLCTACTLVVVKVVKRLLEAMKERGSKRKGALAN